MQPTLSPSRKSKHNWVYATLTVVDGPRRLKPREVCFDRVCFDEPPHLTSGEIEIIVTNGDAEQRSMAVVLPHDANETRIPIRLIKAEKSIEP